MDTLRQDLKFAFRMLVKDRGFAVTAIITLALCIGANSALFTIVRSVLLRPLPFPESSRLVFSYDSFPGAGVERAGTSVPNYVDRAKLTDVFQSYALYQWSGFRVGKGSSSEGVSAMNVTPSLFRVLRAAPSRGRLFTDDDGQPGRNKVAVLSRALAEKQEGGIDGVVGRDIRLDGQPYRVVGVLPESFTFLSPEIRVFVPLAFTDQDKSEEQRFSQNHEAIGRLAPGVTIQQAQARVDALNAAYIERAGPLKSALANAKYHTKVGSFEADMVRDVRGALELLWGGVLFVLLIAAVNITNLSLVRASGRVKELATRHALGAARSRVTRQLVTETTLVTVLGGAAGLGVGFWCLDALKKSGLWDLPRAHEIHMDGVVIAFTFGISVLLGLVVGAVPALQMAGFNLSSVLREDGRTGTASRGARYVRRGLVVAQVALAFVLLIGAGLLLASFRQLLGVDPGFRAEHVITGRVSPLEAQYPGDPALRSYTTRALSRIRALPGVEGAGVSSFLPFSWDGSSSVIVPEGYVMAPGESVVSPNRLHVSDGLPRSVARATEARPVLDIERHGNRAQSHHRRRAAGQEVLAERRPDRSSRLPARQARRHSQTWTDGHLDAGRRGRGRGEVEGPDRRRERTRRCVLHPLRPAAITWYRVRDSRGGRYRCRAVVRQACPRDGRSRIAAVRCLLDAGARRQVAESAQNADGPVAGVWRPGAVPGVARSLRCARLSGDAAHPGDRHSHGPGQR